MLALCLRRPRCKNGLSHQIASQSFQLVGPGCLCGNLGLSLLLVAKGLDKLLSCVVKYVFLCPDKFKFENQYK